MRSKSAVAKSGKRIPAEYFKPTFWKPKALELQVIAGRSFAVQLPAVDSVLQEFEAQIGAKYEQTRNNFGDLFEFKQPASSSFMSLYVSAGAISVQRLFWRVKHVAYRKELIWNQYCILWMRHFEGRTDAEFGPYERIRKWAADYGSQLKALDRKSTKEPLVNAIMNQLTSTGFVSNRLRMIFADFCSRQGIPWLAARQLFERHLVDFFESANTYNWCAAYGLVSQPFRFSIARQMRRFDPNSEYLAKWKP